MEDPLEKVTSGPNLEKQAVIGQKQIQELEIPPGSIMNEPSPKNSVVCVTGLVQHKRKVPFIHPLSVFFVSHGQTRS